MAALPEVESLVSVIDSAVQAALSEPPRGHMGASQIGKECERALWYGFRWASHKQFSGRMLRLFNRGHEEEPRFIRWLTLAGITVSAADANGKQFSFSEPSTGNHFAGSMDGACVGVPGAEKTWHVLEFKTSSAKAFKELCASGVAKAKPEHYAQMQVYMRWTGMERALYMSVNKDDDSLYMERIAYDKQTADLLISRAQRIIESQNPPAGISERADWYQCKFCDFHGLCHGRKEETTGGLGPKSLPDVNCRTCLHATPELDGDARWSCHRWACDIPVEGQRQGCAEHRYIPSLIPWAAQIDANEHGDVLYEIAGESHQPFVNGSSSPSPKVPFYSSHELKDLHPLLIGDYHIQEMHETFSASVVGAEKKAVIDSLEGEIPW